jgi:hypothetical protein
LVGVLRGVGVCMNGECRQYMSVSGYKQRRYSTCIHNMHTYVHTYMVHT